MGPTMSSSQPLSNVWRSSSATASPKRIFVRTGAPTRASASAHHCSSVLAVAARTTDPFDEGTRGPAVGKGAWTYTSVSSAAILFARSAAYCYAIREVDRASQLIPIEHERAPWLGTSEFYAAWARPRPTTRGPPKCVRSLLPCVSLARAEGGPQQHLRRNSRRAQRRWCRGEPHAGERPQEPTDRGGQPRSQHFRFSTSD